MSLQTELRKPVYLLCGDSMGLRIGNAHEWYRFMRWVKKDDPTTSTLFTYCTAVAQLAEYGYAKDAKTLRNAIAFLRCYRYEQVPGDLVDFVNAIYAHTRNFIHARNYRDDDCVFVRNYPVAGLYRDHLNQIIAP